MNSSLARLIPQQMNVEQVKREGWQEHRILVVSADDERLDWMDREWVEQIGKRLYGERNR